MPTEILTDEHRAAYRAYTGDPDSSQLARFFHLDETDLALVRRRNGSHHRLGFALQLCTVRFVGNFLPNPLAVPTAVLTFVARQLSIHDLSTLPRYLEREDTKWEHAQEIRQQYGYAEFTPSVWQFRLTRWLYQRAWLANERAIVLFEHAVAWLVQHKVLLPGATTPSHRIGTT